MSEKRYEIHLNTLAGTVRLDGRLIEVTKEQARTIREQCERIEAEKDCAGEPLPQFDDIIGILKEEPWTPVNGPIEYIHKPGVRAYYIGVWPGSIDNKHVIWVQDEGFNSMVGLEELRPVPPEPEPRQWRQCDIAQWVSGNIYLRGDERWTCALVGPQGNKPIVDATDDEMANAAYLGNLVDWLAQGEVPVFLTEEEADHGTTCIDKKCQYRTAIMEKVKVALAAYRERKKVSP